MRVLLDTDVVLDFLLERNPFFEAASDLFELTANGKFDAYISDIPPVNVFYIGRKIVGATKIRQGVTDLLKLVRINSITREALEEALGLPFVDYEDAVQHAVAAGSGLDAVITRDLGDYKNATLQVFSPLEFLAKLGSQPT